MPFRLSEPASYDLPVPEPMLITVDEYTRMVDNTTRTRKKALCTLKIALTLVSEWTQINSIPACLGVRDKFLLEVNIIYSDPVHFQCL